VVATENPRLGLSVCSSRQEIGEAHDEKNARRDYPLEPLHGHDRSSSKNPLISLGTKKGGHLRRGKNSAALAHRFQWDEKADVALSV
jgi:hypothetical protein